MVPRTRFVDVINPDVWRCIGIPMSLRLEPIADHFDNPQLESHRSFRKHSQQALASRMYEQWSQSHLLCV